MNSDRKISRKDAKALSTKKFFHHDIRILLCGLAP
jgi:hypothetical protein